MSTPTFAPEEFDAEARGFRMPGEFEPHAATWMAWPSRPAIWGDALDEVKQDYARLARTIAGFEPLNMVASPADAQDARRRCGPGVHIVELPIDDSWARDSGPTFITSRRGELRATVWRFNAWGGKYHPHDQDAQLAGRVAASIDAPMVAGGMVLEGGSILSDGAGTLVTTESCLLNANRNPGLGKAAIEAELQRVLGAKKIIWLPGDPTEEETDGHIDGLMAFAEPGQILIESTEDRSDPRYEILRENRRALEVSTDAMGRPFRLWPIEEAEAGPGPRYCRSYVNLYLVNDAVIAPAYGLASDRRVEALLRTVFTKRTVVMLPIGKIAIGGGGFHCVTQQQPLVAGRAKPAADFDAMMRRARRVAPKAPLPSAPSAAQSGFRMPGEFEPQACVWLAWPGATSRQWADEPSLLAEWSGLADAIHRFEPVNIVVDPRYAAECAARMGSQYRCCALPVDDIWIRDTGPSFLLDGRGRLGAVLWNFNTWGGKFDGYERDARLAGELAGALEARQFIAGLIAEGGGLHVDGEGTVVATESALLNPNRNPGMTKAQVESALHAALGTAKVIWLPGEASGDSITDGHVDGLMTFARPGAALFHVSDDRSDPKYHDIMDKLKALQLATDARGRTLEVLTVARPRRLPSASPHFCASYVNCLIVNGAVLIPEFGDADYDQRARAAFERAFPGRTVVALRIDTIAEGGGGIHCISQQQPAPRNNG
jgi:agmatine deiminase